ncbi:MAG: hypothetical protein HYT08_05105 [Candidatus Levybacteria bacterium]|nr:hypothetical protein [Candidatus Levybacteria bacterium]
MSKAGETFFTSVGCMDGRSECTVAKWGREKFGVKYADAITEAGLVGLLSGDHFKANDTGSSELMESIKGKILISIEKHHSQNIVVSGHEDCAGNPVSEEKHKKDVIKTAELVKMMFPAVSVVPVFVKKKNDDWIVEEL